MTKDTACTCFCGNRWMSAAPSLPALAREYEIETADAIHAMDAPAWDSLTDRASIFLSRSLRTHLESHGPTNIVHRYALIRRSGAPVAALAVQCIDVTDEQLAVQAHTTPSLQDRITKQLRNAVLQAAGRRLMVCGDLFSCGEHGLVLSRAASPESVWPAVGAALEQLRAELRADYVLIKDCYDDGAEDCHYAADLGFHRLRIEPEMRLALDPAWTSIEDYLNALRAKYRKAARVIQGDIHAAGFHVQRLTDLRPVADHLHELYGQVEARADIRFGLLPKHYFTTLAEFLGQDAFRCTVIFEGEHPVGFSFVLRDHDTAAAHVVGFDYAANEKAPVYLRLLQTIIEDALDLGCRQVAYGRTALEPKARLGAQPRATHTWLRHRNPLLNALTGRAVQLAPSAQAPQRQPFKD